MSVGPEWDVKDSGCGCQALGACSSTAASSVFGGWAEEEGWNAGDGPVVPAEFLSVPASRLTDPARAPQPPFLSGLSRGGAPLHIASAPAKH